MSNESDDLDYAQVMTQKLTDMKINEIRKKALFVVEGDGYCLVCEATVDPITVCGKPIAGRFCSVECRNAYAADQMVEHR